MNRDVPVPTEDSTPPKVPAPDEIKY